MPGGGTDLNLLVPLRALLEEANVTRAAERVQMSQSSMSTALARLRAAFSDDLLIRVGRGYELTPFARVLLPQVQGTVPLIEGVLSGGRREDPDAGARAYSVMMSDYAFACLRGALSEVLAAAPSATIEVEPMPEWPLDGESELLSHDFVVAPRGMGIDGPSVPLLTDECVCLVDRSNPAIRDGVLSLDDYLRLPHAVARFGRHYLTPADRRLAELGVDRIAPTVATTSFLPLPSIVAGTDLVAVVPGALARLLGPVTGTVGVPMPCGPIPIEVLLWWHESRALDPSHVWLRHRLVAGLGAVPQRAP